AWTADINVCSTPWTSAGSSRSEPVCTVKWADCGAGKQLIPQRLRVVPGFPKCPKMGYSQLTYRCWLRPSNCKEKGLQRTELDAGRLSTDKGDGWRERWYKKLPFFRRDGESSPKSN